MSSTRDYPVHYNYNIKCIKAENFEEMAITEFNFEECILLSPGGFQTTEI